MNLLYLAEDYLNSKVHHQLCNAIANTDNNISIQLFAIKRTDRKYNDLRDSYKDIVYTPHITSFNGSYLLYRCFFPYKVWKKYHLLKEKINMKEIDFTHAATLFSEGSIALMLFEKFGIPYTIAVRGVDINLYLKKMPHLWALGRKIIRHAQKVVFITPSHRLSALQSAPLQSIKLELEKKSVVIHNGIDDFWIENRSLETAALSGNHILYTGRFDKNKNVEMLINACNVARKTILDLHLNLVGGSGNCEKKNIKLAQKHQDWITLHGVIYNQDKLCHIFRQNHIFAMPSHSETFGLVYIEALTQGVPVLYTEKQGFDGFYPSDTVGYAVNSRDKKAISAQIVKLFQTRSTLQKSIHKLSFEQFSWKRIAENYLVELKVFGCISKRKFNG